MREFKRIKVYKEGDVFNKVTFVKELQEKFMWGGRNRIGIFKCFCGNTFQCTFRTARAKEHCGCLTLERKRKASTKHGLRYHKYYSCAKAAHNRCYNHKDKKYKDYGGRGISLFSEWIDNIPKFVLWLEENLPERPESYTLDRIDVNGNYEPGNLRWASPLEQGNNKRNNFKIEIEGVNYSLSELSRKHSICPGAIKRRYNKGLRGNDLFHKKEPLISCKSQDVFILFGKEITYGDLTKKFGIPRGSVYDWKRIGGDEYIEKKVKERLNK